MRVDERAAEHIGCDGGEEPFGVLLAGEVLGSFAPVGVTLAADSYSGYDTSMAVSKVSLSIDEDVLAQARDRAGRRELSSYVNEALRRQLQHDRLGDLLAEMEAESGSVPDELMEEARQVWRGAAAKPKPRRRRA